MQKDSLKTLIEHDPIAYANVAGRLKYNGAYTLHEFGDGLLFQQDYWFAPVVKDLQDFSEFSYSGLLSGFLWPEKMGFCGIPTTQADAIERALEPRYRLDWDERCSLHFVPKHLAGQFESRLAQDQEDVNVLGLRYSVLEEADVPTVDLHYTYRDAQSIAYLRECIGSRPTACLRNGAGEPVSWALIREDGSMGVMFTLPQYRKRGLALLVSRHLIRQVFALGDIPYIHIVEGNLASMGLAAELGFEQWGEIRWFGLVQLDEA